MTVHRHHPDPDRNDPPDALLFDDCDRCDEHVAWITSMDGETLATILGRPPLTAAEDSVHARVADAARVLASLRAAAVSS